MTGTPSPVRLEVAANVAAGLWPAVEPGLQPGGKNRTQTRPAGYFMSRKPSNDFVRAAGCTPTAAKMGSRYGS